MIDAQTNPILAQPSARAAQRLRCAAQTNHEMTHESDSPSVQQPRTTKYLAYCVKIGIERAIDTLPTFIELL
jgi:hypothetical protein